MNITSKVCRIEMLMCWRGEIKLDREDAVIIIHQIINSGIISDELENELIEICNRIENDDWEE